MRRGEGVGGGGGFGGSGVFDLGFFWYLLIGGFAGVC